MYPIVMQIAVSPDKNKDLDELESNLQLHSFFYLLDNEQR